MRHGTLESGAPVGRWVARVWLLAGLLAGALPVRGEELWRMPGPLLAHDNGDGVDVMHGAVKPQDDTSSATLYFKFTVDPLADVSVDIDTPYLECSQTGRTRCRKEIPDNLPPVAIRAESRHNLTLVVKEALTNTLQHAGAANVWLRLKWEAPDLEIVVEDDGCGFDPATTDELGNGLRNQHARMAKIGGDVNVRSAVGQGTSTRIRLRLAPDGSPPARRMAGRSQDPRQPDPS